MVTWKYALRGLSLSLLPEPEHLQSGALSSTESRAPSSVPAPCLVRRSDPIQSRLEWTQANTLQRSPRSLEMRLMVVDFSFLKVVFVFPKLVLEIILPLLIIQYTEHDGLSNPCLIPIDLVLVLVPVSK